MNKGSDTGYQVFKLCFVVVVVFVSVVVVVVFVSVVVVFVFVSVVVVVVVFATSC